MIPDKQTTETKRKKHLSSGYAGQGPCVISLLVCIQKIDGQRIYALRMPDDDELLGKDGMPGHVKCLLVDAPGKKNTTYLLNRHSTHALLCLVILDGY